MDICTCNCRTPASGYSTWMRIR